MKKLVFGAALVALTATGANAAPFSDLQAFRDQANDINTTATDKDIDFDISGFLPKECDVAAFGVEGSSQDRLGNIDLSTRNAGDLLGAQNASISTICNFAGQAQLTFTSANGGNLVSPNASIPYTLEGSGQIDQIDGQSLASPVVDTVSFTAANDTQTGSFNVRLGAKAVIAGTYTDTITIAVAPL